MVRNRIKVMRAEADISAVALSKELSGDVDKVVMSYIEKGRVLPTRDDLEKMCKVLGCQVTDLYSLDDIDLRSVGKNAEQPSAMEQPVIKPAEKAAVNKVEFFTRDTSESKDTHAHEGMEQLRVWMGVDEKAALVKAVYGLGYKSVAEWLREMYRQTVHKYIALGLKDAERLHEAVPPTTQNQSIGS